MPPFGQIVRGSSPRRGPVARRGRAAFMKTFSCPRLAGARLAGPGHDSRDRVDPQPPGKPVSLYRHRI